VNHCYCHILVFVVILCNYCLLLFGLELAREEQDHPFHRGGAITPEGLIDEDFEEELGSPTQVVNYALSHMLYSVEISVVL